MLSVGQHLDKQWEWVNWASIIITTTQRNPHVEVAPHSELTEQPRNNSLRSFKTEEYQSKIYELSNQVKLLRDRLHIIEQDKSQSAEHQIAQLQADNVKLQRENKTLKLRVRELQQKLKVRPQDNFQLASVKSLGSKGNYLKNPLEAQHTHRESSKGESRLTATTTQLLRQLLAECNEPSEGGVGPKTQKNKDQFYQFKNSADCFQPWLSQLPKQLKIRLKRCLTRPKQLLWASTTAQLGCICPYNPSPSDLPQFSKLLLVLTNISPNSITNITLSPLFAKDVHLARKGKQASKRWEYPGQLRFNQQLREEIEITVNNIDFRCVQMEMSFEMAGQKQHHLLILALSKAKLFRWTPYSAPSAKCQRIERVFEFQRRVLSEVEKIGNLWNVVEGRQKVGARYYWKVQFLTRTFWLEAGRVQEKLMIGVKFQNQRALAEKVLDQYVFLFQKL